MIFNYYAKKISGEEKRGVQDAKDKFELAQILRQEGYILISCGEVSNAKKIDLSFLKLGRVSTADKMLFSRNLSVMIEAGLPLVRALDILSRQSKNKKFKKIIKSLMESVQKGNSLSESMKNYPEVFSSLFTAMVRVGEESGQLSGSLRLVAEQLERDYLLTKKVKGAMIYPSIIILFMVGVGIFMFIYVVPTLIDTFKEMQIDLPTSTKIIIKTSEALSNHGLIAVSGIIIVFFLFLFFFKTQFGKRATAAISLYTPIISPIVKKINAARTSRTLSSLISAGVNLIDALAITQDVVQNYRYKNVLENAKIMVQKGESVSLAFKNSENLYPALVGELISVGEETGKLSEMLGRLAAFFESEVAEATKDMTTVIEPLLMIVVGTAIGFFAISMISPMYSMMGGV